MNRANPNPTASNSAPSQGEAIRAVEIMPLPALACDDEGRLIATNEAARRLIGGNDGRVTGVADLFVSQGDAAAVLRLLAAGGGGLEGAGGYEARLRPRNGAPVWVLVTARPLDGSHVLVLQDITPLKIREAELDERRSRAERETKAKMRFFAAASHDLRQPLQALALFVSALEPHVAAPAAQPIMHSVKQSLQIMEEMFNGLLDMSRLEAGVLKAEPKPFIIADVLEQLEMEFDTQVKAGGVDLRVVLSSESVISDPVLLTRILRNFLSNALRHTRRGRILLGCRHRGDSLRVEVCDTGRGIPEDQRLAIFEEFYQGAGNGGGSGGGLGLGLAIVQKLASLLHHRLDVRSTVDKGSCFAVEVPLADGRARQTVTAAASTGDDIGAGMPDLSGCAIVVVDDDEDIRRALALLFGQWRCRAVIAASADEALRALQDAALVPEIVLADLCLDGDHDGISAIQRITAAVGHAIPAFLFTGSTERRREPLTSGDFPILHKPVDPPKLAWIIAEAVGRA